MRGYNVKREDEESLSTSLWSDIFLSNYVLETWFCPILSNFCFCGWFAFQPPKLLKKSDSQPWRLWQYLGSKRYESTGSFLHASFLWLAVQRTPSHPMPANELNTHKNRVFRVFQIMGLHIWVCGPKWIFQCSSWLCQDLKKNLNPWMCNFPAHIKKLAWKKSLNKLVQSHPPAKHKGLASKLKGKKRGEELVSFAIP